MICKLFVKLVPSSSKRSSNTLHQLAVPRRVWLANPNSHEFSLLCSQLLLAQLQLHMALLQRTAACSGISRAAGTGCSKKRGGHCSAALMLFVAVILPLTGIAKHPMKAPTASTRAGACSHHAGGLAATRCAPAHQPQPNPPPLQFRAADNPDWGTSVISRAIAKLSFCIQSVFVKHSVDYRFTSMVY